MTNYISGFGRRKGLLVPFVRYHVKKVKGTGILIDKPKYENPNNAYTMRDAHTIIDHFGDII